MSAGMKEDVEPGSAQGSEEIIVKNL